MSVNPLALTPRVVAGTRTRAVIHLDTNFLIDALVPGQGAILV